MGPTEFAQRYLERIAHPAPTVLDRATLETLHVAHLRTVPFENLDIHRDVPIVLDIDRIIDKIVARRRGGFCYEANGAFAALLRALGYRVDLCEARVYDRDRLGIRYDHLCLLVHLDDGPRLADVGFGELFDAPLTLLAGIEQSDAAGAFRLDERPDGFWDLWRDDVAAYRFDRTPRELAEFAPGCDHHQSSPDSHFTRDRVATRRTESGRITLAGTRFVTRTDGRRDERAVGDDELDATLRSEFGIDLSIPTPLPEIDRSEAEAFWSRYLAASGGEPAAAFTDIACFGDSVELANDLLALVLDGPKRATAGSVAEYEAEGVAIPQVGDGWVACDGGGRPRAVLETTDVRVGPLSSVDDAFAWDEGEGDRTRQGWLDDHTAYFVRTFARRGFDFHHDIDVVFERFDLVYSE